MNHAEILVVGAGFAGAVCAERLASAGHRVLLIDKRTHVGGNAYDEHDAHGVLVHRYGPHIFHTNSKSVFEYLSRFTAWRFYEHRVRTLIDGKLYPIPINRTTINSFYGLSLSEEEVGAYLARVREPREPVKTSEDAVLNAVGRDLCEKFFRGYTQKQWGCDLSELSAAVAFRIPVRTNDDDRYFTDTYQFMPAEGFTAIFRRMLGHPNIDVQLGVDYGDISGRERYSHIVYTGPIDAFFGHRFGPLPYRSLRFEHEHLPRTPQYQPVAVVNYPNDYDFTRVTEFRHMTGQDHTGTSLVREYPQGSGDPYYPIPCEESEKLYRKYRALADQTPNVSFVGRLAEYRYYNMDKVVEAALAAMNAGRDKR